MSAMGATGRSTKRAPFAATVARPDRRTAGRTWAPATPLAVRTSGLAVDPALRRRIHRRLGERLGKFAGHIERLSVRFEDVNGPRGGVDVACRIKAVVSGLPSPVVTELAKNPREAFDRAGERFERVVRRSVGRGRARGKLDRMRPPGGRPHPVQTVEAPTSTADRNRKARAPKATAALEGSTRARPSRKSTRKSANRAKQGNKLARREKRRVSSRNARRAQAANKR